MKKATVIILFFCHCFTSQAIKQSNVESSKNLYTHAVDTIVATITQEYPQRPVVVCADEFILKRIPDSISGHRVEKVKDLKLKKKFDNYTWIQIERFMFDQEKLYVFSKVMIQKNLELVDLPDLKSNIRLQYLCDHDDQKYELVEFKTGVSQIEQ